MICVNCGSNIPEGAFICPVCGIQLIARQQNYNDNFNAEYNYPQYGDYNQIYYGPVTEKKKRFSVLAGIIVTAIIIAAVLIIKPMLDDKDKDRDRRDGVSKEDEDDRDWEEENPLVKFLLGNEYDGTYQFCSVKMYGVEYTVDDFKDMGVDVDGCLIVDGHKVTLDMDGLGLDSSGSATIEIDGDSVVCTDDGEVLNGKYDRREKIISLEVEGVEMCFKKND